MLRVLLTGLLTAGLAGPACAQEAASLQKCLAITEAQARLACFDSAMKTKPSNAAPATAAPSEEATTSTKEIVNAAAATDPNAPIAYKPIDADDLYVAPGKYEGRGVELKRMRCFHADKDEYRCGAAGALTLTVFTVAITPASEREGIENDCGEVKKMASPKCLKTLRFIPVKHDEDIVSGYKKRVIILARSIEVVPSGKTGKR